MTDVSPLATAPTLWNYDVCAQYPGVVGPGVTIFQACTSVMPLRKYLVVQLERANAVLNFCEIEVYARCKLVFVYSHLQSNIKLGKDEINVNVTTCSF